MNESWDNSNSFDSNITYFVSPNDTALGIYSAAVKVVLFLAALGNTLASNPNDHVPASVENELLLPCSPPCTV